VNSSKRISATDRLSSSSSSADKNRGEFVLAQERAPETSIDLCTINGTIASMTDIAFVLKVVFYRSEAGNEPVRVAERIATR
jgi:hypothetical protein